MTKQILPNRWFIWAMVVIVLTGFSVWGFIEYSNIEMDHESVENGIILHRSQTSTQNDFLGWKTYRNEEYGFEVKYPQNWAVENGMHDAVWIVDTEQKNRVGERPIIISITPEKAESMENWFEKRIAEAYRQAGMPAEYEDIVINGIKGRELPIGITEGGCDRHAALFRKGVIFNIFTSVFCNDNKEVIEAVINSFRFFK